ncbi:hypothetical protein BH09PSE1_BH09PSE1_30360 [soil metagenome]
MLLLRPLMHYADFRGRASRSEYWLFMVSQGLIYIGCVLMAGMSLGKHDMSAQGLGVLGWLIAVPVLMTLLALPNYAVLARRLHDSGRSAKWMALLLPTIAVNFVTFKALGSLAKQVPVAGLDGGEAIAQAALSQLAGIGVIAIVASVCNLALFVMTLMPGTRGPNRFGPDPKDHDGLAPSDGGGLDDDRWDALIAEAKGAARANEEPYKPIFDFGPGLAKPESTPVATAAQTTVDWGRPAWDPGVAPSRPFGKRA